MRQVTLDLSESQCSKIEYFLGARYGKRKKIKRLIFEAINEAIKTEAKNQLDNLFQTLEDQ